jgi:hypothetical protein
MRYIFALILSGILVLSSCTSATTVPPTANLTNTAEVIVLPTSTSTPAPAEYPKALGDRVVFTHYFYWYDSQTGEHLGPHGPSDATAPLTDEPVPAPSTTWRGTEWHRKQIEDMLYAGVDVILPVYWGNAAAESWSRPGLENLAAALEEVRLSGTTPPAVAMFYDTNAHVTEPVDLLTDQGKDAVYADVKFFFTAIPKAYWALTENNRPMIWFHKVGPFRQIDPAFMEYIHSHFEQDFGVRPYIVLDSSWIETQAPAQFDAVSLWIAADFGSTEKITTISPGVDDRWILSYPSHSYVDRQNGDVYRNAWTKSVLCGTPWVVIESWNQFHEATDIAETIQYGRQYLDLSHEYVSYFKQNTLPADGLISQYKTSPEVSVTLGETNDSLGLTLNVEQVDGLSSPIVKENVSARINGQGHYMYFYVDDGFYFNTPQPIDVTITYFDEGQGTIHFEYDSAPCASNWSVASMYRSIPMVELSDTKTWQTVTLTVTDATFAGHQNGFSDFRIAGPTSAMVLGNVTITKK